MLKNIPTCLSPELLKTLDEMGHGDEIVIGDGNFPSSSLGPKVIRADGIGGEEILKAILSLIPLDTYSEPNFMLMETTNGDPTPTIWKSYDKIVKKADPNAKKGLIERYAFYERAKKAFCIVQTSEKAIYANVILKKGVVK
ncbi:MAG TPA: L-fucose mutarotase [Firmicutes bacterium]|nr:L-fucose mutarotase [Bacillota bacterium]